jgi:hypothetical protein
MAKLIQGFITLDNKFFETEKEAMLHEASLDFINQYKETKLSNIQPKTMKNWLVDNKDIVKNFIDKL